MLSARRKSDGQTVNAYSESKTDGPFYCLECGDPVALKVGKSKISHFAHVNPLVCNYALNESDQHRRCKMEIYEALRREPNVQRVALERSLDNVRPDVSAVMLIGGGYNGGYISLPVSVNSSNVNFSGDVQPLHYTDTSAFTFNPTAGDPVDMANGTFQIEHTDLSVGGKEPRGITLSRYYNGARRFSNPSGMADGWVNNYTISANTVAAPQAGLGGRTPAQMAPMLVATAAAAGIYSVQNPDPKNWLVTALIAKWGVDQLTKGGVSVQMGKDTVQFVKQPEGAYTPPANCTMTLLETNGSYRLQQRHGNAFKFDCLGRLTNIMDQYAQPLTVSYLNSTSSLPQTVTDWKGRALTFHYTGTPLRLTSVSDNSSPSRTVYYGYGDAYNTNDDLTSFEDADGNTSRYEYDANHDITATIDALNRLVVSNNYNALGHVTTQLTQGDTNKTWHIFWSDWQTIAQDPAGGDPKAVVQEQRLSEFKELVVPLPVSRKHETRPESPRCRRPHPGFQAALERCIGATG